MNPTKTKDMVISGTKEAIIPKLTVGDQELERVTSSKLVGLHILNDLKWDTHVNYIVDSSKKKLFFLAQLKRAKVAEKDLVLFYKSIVRSKLEYAAPAFSTSLPQNLKDKIEAVQKRAMNIIYPNLTYGEAMKYAKINTLNERRLKLCKTFFNSIQDSKNVLNHLLPEKRSQSYSLRTKRKYPILHCNTSRFKNTLIPYSLINFQ